MVDTLAEIDKNGGGDKLLGFIQQHYPYMLIDEAPAQSQSVSSDDVFGYFNPNILTYPRRIIFTGPENELRRKIQEFTIDKIKSDSVIVNGVAYIEYLTQDDSSVKDSVPQKSWLIARWKLRHQSLT